MLYPKANKSSDAHDTSDVHDDPESSPQIAHARHALATAEATAKRAYDQYKFHAISLLMLERTIVKDEQRGDVKHAAALRGLLERYRDNVENAMQAMIKVANTLQEARTTLAALEQVKGLDVQDTQKERWNKN